MHTIMEGKLQRQTSAHAGTMAVVHLIYGFLGAGKTTFAAPQPGHRSLDPDLLHPGQDKKECLSTCGFALYNVQLHFSQQRVIVIFLRFNGKITLTLLS
jgi:hypothetical protein